MTAAELLKDGERAYASRDYVLALERNLAAREKYHRIKDVNGQLACLANLGNIYQAQGRIDLSAAAYEDALAISDRYAGAASTSIIATCMLNLGGIRGMTGNLEGALELFIRCLDHCDRLNDDLGQMRCLTNLGLAYQRHRDYDRARDAFQRALALAVPSDNTEVQLTCHFQLGLLDEALADLQQAKIAYLKALPLARLLDRPDLTVKCLLRLGAVQRSLAEYDAALTTFREAAEVYRRLDKDGDMATVLVEIALTQEAAEDLPAASLSYWEALCALGTADGPEAVQAAATLMSRIQKVDPSGYGALLFQAGLDKQTQGDAIIAIKLYQKALMIYEQAGQSESVALCYLAIATCNKELNDKPGAYEALLQALGLYRQTYNTIGATDGFADCLYEIGLFHNGEGRLREALPLYSEAANINRERGRVERMATCLLAVGHCHRYLGELHEALEKFRHALEVTRSLKDPDPEALAMCLFSLGDTYRALHDYPKALECFEEQLKTNRNSGASTRVAGSLRALGSLYAVQGDSARAEVFYEEALELGEQLQDKRGVADTLVSLGHLYQPYGAEGRRRALPFFQEALAAFDEIKDRTFGRAIDIAQCTITIADILASERDLEGAVYHYEKAHRMLSSIEQPERLMRVLTLRYYIGIGDVREEEGRIAEALEAYCQAVALARSFGELTMIAMTTGLRGMIFVKTGDLVSARRDLLDAIETVEQLRLDLKANRDRKIHIFGQFTNFYLMIIEEILWPQRELATAFEHLESCKGRTLTRLLDPFDRQPSDLVPSAIAGEYDELVRQERALDMWPEEREAQGPIDDERAAVAMRLSSLIERIVDHDPDFDLGARSSVARLTELHEVLDDDTAVVEIFSGRARNLAFVITKRNGIAGVEISECSAQDLNHTAKAWLAGFETQLEMDGLPWGEVIDRTLAHLYKQFWTPIQQLISSDVTKIVFVPHGLFHLFPLHAMYKIDSDRRCYLLEEYSEISYAPSAAVFARCEKRRRHAGRRFVAIDNPTGDLNHASEEVDAVSALFDDRLVLGPRWKDAPVAEVIFRETRRANVVLWTGHSVGGAPDRALVHLANGNVLTLQQLFRGLYLPVTSLWDFDTCETAFHFPEASDEWVNLASAPLCAGARTVWSSLWKVDDLPTAVLKERAFQNFVHRSMGAAKALNEAQRWMLRGGGPTILEEQYRHPLYWAAFISSGGT